MFLAPDDLQRITQDIWWNLLELDLITVPVPRGGDDALATGRVAILGEWCGDVTVQCSSRLARQAAGRMFGASADTIPDADVLDTVGELANITGGNVKSLLAGPSQLSLPSTTFEPLLDEPAPEVVERIACRYDGELLIVTVRERPAREQASRPGLEVTS